MPVLLSRPKRPNPPFNLTPASLGPSGGPRPAQVNGEPLGLCRGGLPVAKERFDEIDVQRVECDRR